VLLALLTAAAVGLTPYGPGQVAFSFADPRIAESSGLVASSRDDGVVFTHNDSGDAARFFAVDRTGRTVDAWALPGVQARDWEDIARGPDEDGRSSLFLADIGDNRGTREGGILVHRVPEPRVGERLGPVVSFRLVYPDQPKDAETLLVHPRTGRLYVVSKAPLGPSVVYAAPERLDAGGRNTLQRQGEVEVPPSRTAGGPQGAGAFGRVLVTAGDISPDGRRVALRTYTDLLEWPLRDADVPAALGAAPTVTPLPPTGQGEGLAYSRDGRSVLTSSEGSGAPVHRLSAGRQPEGAAVDTRRPRDRLLPLALAAGGLAAALLVALLRGRRTRRLRPR
jgi:hypothetical protein